MSDVGLKNYVVVPRVVAADYRNGRINRAELQTYLWMRINGNPYGIAYMSLETVAEDVFGSSKKKNYVNKIMLSLKSKRYIFYEQRSGRRGSFEVHFGEWIVPGKNEAGKPIIKSLDHLFADAAVRRPRLVLNNPHSEEYAEDALQFQSFESQTEQEDTNDSSQESDDDFRSPDNDKDNETDTETKRTSAYGRHSFSLNEFVPKSYEEELCLAFARELGEEDMGFILGSLKKHGIRTIEVALLKTRKAMNEDYVEDPCRLFNYLVRQVAEESQMI